MHKFWYHSPVRFYRTLSELQDAKNPQNTQYFGEKNPYPLELGDFHRYLIPNYQNTVASSDLSIWVVNEKKALKILGVFNVEGGKLKYLTFKSKIAISGRLEIRDSDNNTIFYSNCIQFLDSTDNEGRKFIRIATKHTYNRNLFDYSNPKSYILTSLPAYCLGISSVEADINNSRTGGISTLRTRETFLDEIVDYEFTASGDSNILNFIQVHATNNEFYIDETKRTSVEKLDKDEFSMFGKVKFTNVKDNLGFNIPINYVDIIDDIYQSIYADNVTYNFTYSHEPIDTTNEGQWFLTNLLFNNYHNSFGITYDCDLKIKLFGIPVKGFLANNLTRQIYQVGDIISYCDKDKLVYFPNGFDNDLGVTGNYIELFTYKIIDQEDRIGRLISHTISMTDSAVEPIDISVAISWLDLTSTPKTGNLPNITVKVASLVFDPLDPIISQEWEIWDGTSWIFYKAKTTDTEVLSLSYLDNKIRFKVVSQFSIVAYSNVLTYEKTNTSTIYITDEVEVSPGVKTFKLHIEDYDFVGFENMQGEKNANTRNGIVNSTLGGVLSIPSLNDMGEYARKSTAVTLPIGIYDYTISVNGNPRSTALDLFVGGLVGYGYTTSINDNLAEVNVELFIEAV